MSASGVRAGRVFVEIGAETKAFFSAVGRINRAIGSLGKSMVGGGNRLAAVGIGMAAPIVAAVRSGAKFESVLLGIRASTGATAAELDRVKAASMAMSSALGVGPTEAAQGMLELLKAGLPLEAVLGGAGQAAIEFAKVGEMDVAQAAVVMSDAMNVFGVSGSKAANTLSAAADASSTSIELMSQSFAQASAVASMANQSIDHTAAAIALMAKAGVKGSDAGTSFKTMFMKLIAPSNETASAMRSVGLSMKDFSSGGKMHELPQIIGTLNNALGKLDPVEKKRVLAEMFGSDAVRAAQILTNAGVDGFNAMLETMSQALPVGEKFKALMSGMAGSGARLLAALERLAIAVSDAVAPALAGVVPFIAGMIDGLVKLASSNKDAVARFAGFAVAAIGVGSAMVGLGVSLQVVSFGMAGVGKAVMFALSPLSVLYRNVSRVGKSFALAMPETIKLANAIGSSMMSGAAAVTSFVASSTSALAGFAVASTSSLAGLAASGIAGFARMSSAASAAAQAMFPVFFTGFNRGIAAGAGFFAATLRGLNGVVMASSTLGGALFAVSGSGMAQFVNVIVGGLTLTYKSFVWWATGASARMAQYAANLTGAAGKTIASAAAMSAAWVGSALRGVTAFVGPAIAGIGAYLASVAVAVAGSVASAAAVAAAWLAPLAPLLLLSAAAIGVGIAVKQFGSQIAAAFSGVGEWVSQAAGAIGSGFTTAISDAIVVFGDLFATATTTFNGVYEAIAAGDLAGAMDILWAGLVAGWLRGVEALMSYVDPWTAAFQDVFTDIGASIVTAWDFVYTNSAAVLNTMGAWMLGFFDNIANGVMSTFDTLVGNVQKAWIRVQGFIAGAKDTEARIAEIDNANAAREEQRRQERPGIESRTEKAAGENAREERLRQQRATAVAEDAQKNKDARQVENKRRADQRRADTQAAEDNVTSTTNKRRSKRVMDDQYSVLLKDIEAATSLDQLHDLHGQFQALNDNGRLTSGQADILESAITDAQERISRAGSSMGASPAEKAATGGAAGAGDQSKTSMGAVAGTFSSLNLGAAFGGQSAADRTARACEEIARNTRDNKGDKVAA